MADENGKQRRRIRGAMIGGSDLVPQLVHDLSVPLRLRGINDFSKHLRDFRILWERVHITPNYFQQDWRWDLEKYDIFCNLVSDGDRNPKTLTVVQRMAQAIDRPMINDPAQVPLTAREELPRAIGDIDGVIMPRTIRVNDATLESLKSRAAEVALNWPVLVRKPGTHGGYFVGLFASPDEIAPHLAESRRDYLLTQFVDFASPDGLYRKCRFFFIGDSIVLRHLIVADSWNVHGRDRQGLMMERPELRREEERALGDQLDAFPRRTADILSEIRARIDLDYFGIDCHVAPSGDVLVFEANATMNYKSKFEGAPEYRYIGQRLTDITRKAVKRLLEEKLGEPVAQRPSATIARSATDSYPSRASETETA